MTVKTHPALDASTLSERTQEIEKLNEVEAPEERTGTLGSATTFDEVFQFTDFSKFSAACEFTAPENEGGTGNNLNVKVYGSWSAGESVGNATFRDVTYALYLAQDGQAVTQAAAIAIDRLATWNGVIVDTDEVLKGATYVKIEMDVVEFSVTAGDYTIEKNARA